MALGVENPGQRGREHQDRAESRQYSSPARPCRRRDRVSECWTMGICRRNEFRGFGVRPPVSGGVGWGDVGEEPGAATGNGLNETRSLRRGAPRFTHLGDCFVEVVIEVDDRMAPEV